MLTETEIGIIRHALTGGGGKVYRNHYVGGPGDEQVLRKLVDGGYLVIFETPSFFESSDIFCRVTAKGADAAGLSLPQDSKK